MKGIMNIYQKILCCIICLIFIAACQQSQNGTCISPASPPASMPEADSFTLYANGYANNGNTQSWISTNIAVSKGDVVDVGALGTITLCPGTIGMDGSNNGQGQAYFISAANVPWTPTTYAGEGDYVQIIVAGPNDNPPPPSPGISRFSAVSHNCTGGCPSSPTPICSGLVDSSDWYGGHLSDGTTPTPYSISCYSYEQLSTECGGQVYCSNSHPLLNTGLNWRFSDACLIADWDSSNPANNTICTNRVSANSSCSSTCWNIQGAALAFAFVPIGQTQSAFDYTSNGAIEFDTSNPIYSGNNTPPTGQNYPTTVYPKPIPTTVDPFNPLAAFAQVPSDSSLQFKIDDGGSGGSDQNYFDNLGGYTVYIKKVPCVAQNGAPVVNGNFGSAGALEARVASSLPEWGAPYDSSSALAIGSSTNAPSDGVIFLRIYDGGEGSYLDTNGNRYDRKTTAYTNNQGSLSVNVTVQHQSSETTTLKANTLFSNDPSTVIKNSIQQMFNGFNCTTGVSCTDYPGVIRLVIELYIILYAIMFTMGLVKVSQADLVIRLFKLGLVLALISPNSWDFFNNYFFSAFINGVNQVINMASGNSIDGSPFTFVGPVLDQMLLPLAPVYISAFILAGPAGIVVFFILIISIYRFMVALFMSFASYVMAILAVAILISVGPIFIPFILFAQTKQLFENWLRLIVRYTMEPIFLLVGLAFIMGLFMIAMSNIVSDQVCYKCAFVVDVTVFNLSIANFCIHWFLPSGFDNYSANIFVGLINKLDLILILLIFSDAVKNYSKFSVSIVAALTGSSGSSIADGAGQMAVKAITETAKKPFGMDEQSKARRKQNYTQDEYQAESAAKQKAGIAPDIAEKIHSAPGKAWNAIWNSPQNINQGSQNLYNRATKGSGPGSSGGSGSSTGPLSSGGSGKRVVTLQNVDGSIGGGDSGSIFDGDDSGSIFDDFDF